MGKTGNRVFVNGVEKFDVTIKVIDGVVESVTPNSGNGPTTQGGNPPGDGGPGPGPGP